MHIDASGEASELFVGHCLQKNRLTAEGAMCNIESGRFESMSLAERVAALSRLKPVPPSPLVVSVERASAGKLPS